MNVFLGKKFKVKKVVKCDVCTDPFTIKMEGQQPICSKCMERIVEDPICPRCMEDLIIKSKNKTDN